MLESDQEYIEAEIAERGQNVPAHLTNKADRIRQSLDRILAEVQQYQQRIRRLENANFTNTHKLQVPEDTGINHRNIEYDQLLTMIRPNPHATENPPFEELWEKLTNWGAQRQLSHQDYRNVLSNLLSGSQRESYQALQHQPLNNVISTMASLYVRRKPLAHNQILLRDFVRSKDESIDQAMARYRILLNLTMTNLPQEEEMARQFTLLRAMLLKCVMPKAKRALERSIQEATMLGTTPSFENLLQKAVSEEMLERQELPVFMADNAEFGGARRRERRASRSPTSQGRLERRRDSRSPSDQRPTPNSFRYQGGYREQPSFDIDNSGTATRSFSRDTSGDYTSGRESSGTDRRSRSVKRRGDSEFYSRSPSPKQPHTSTPVESPHAQRVAARTPLAPLRMDRHGWPQRSPPPSPVPRERPLPPMVLEPPRQAPLQQAQWVERPQYIAPRPDTSSQWTASNPNNRPAGTVYRRAVNNTMSMPIDHNRTTTSIISVDPYTDQAQVRLLQGFFCKYCNSTIPHNKNACYHYTQWNQVTRDDWRKGKPVAVPNLEAAQLAIPELAAHLERTHIAEEEPQQARTVQNRSAATAKQQQQKDKQSKN
jgi:hypothetical protein